MSVRFVVCESPPTTAPFTESPPTVEADEEGIETTGDKEGATTKYGRTASRADKREIIFAFVL